MPSFLRTEPTLIVSAVRAIVTAAVLFGLDLTTEQIAGVLVALEAVLALVNRSQVAPVVDVVEVVDVGPVPGDEV